MKKPKIEAAWAAGFFDGEGCTTVTSFKNKTKKGIKKSSSIRMSVAQVEIEPLKRFFSAVNIGAIRGPYKYGTNKQYHFQWNASGRDVFRALKILWPYLSNVKKRQARKNINLYRKHLKIFPTKISSTGYIGVSKNLYGRFACYLYDKGECFYLGTYDTAKEAAKVHDDRAKILKGKKAKLNFSKEVFDV